MWFEKLCNHDCIKAPHEQMVSHLKLRDCIIQLCQKQEMIRYQTIAMEL